MKRYLFLFEKTLAYRRSEYAAELLTDLALMVGRENGDDSVDGLDRVEGVESADYEVACFGCGECDFNRFEVTHFADHDYIRILTERCSESGRK